MTYSFTVLLQTLVTLLAGLTWPTVLMEFIGFCLFGEAFVKDIDINLHDIFNKIPIRSKAKRLGIKKHLHETIQFHADAKL